MSIAPAAVRMAMKINTGSQEAFSAGRVASSTGKFCPSCGVIVWAWTEVGVARGVRVALAVEATLVGVDESVVGVAVARVGVGSAGLITSLSPGKISELVVRLFSLRSSENSIW